MGRCHGNDYGDVRPMSAEEQELLFDATLILIPVPGASAYGSVKLLRFMAKHPKITKNLCVVTILCGLPPTSKIGQAASSIFEDIVIIISMTATHTLILLFRTMRPLIKQIPKRPRLRPVCKFTTANHRDGATNNRIPNSIANHLKHILIYGYRRTKRR
jgi:hypothetical protein